MTERLQDKALVLLQSSRAGTSRTELQTTIDELLDLQQKDGGWGQEPEMSSDAFATGQVL